MLVVGLRFLRASRSFGHPSARPRERSPGEPMRMKALTSRWWSTPPMGFNAIVKVPVHEIELTENVGGVSAVVSPLSSIVLPSEIFNAPIRKDVVHGVYWGERRARAGFQEQLQLYKWEWPGSNRKARPFLNTGLPKMGRRKAPGKWDGSFARPVRSVDFRQKVNRRLVLLALRSVLSSKVAEGNLHVVGNFHTQTHKTKNIRTHLGRIVGGRTARLLVVHDKEDISDNFRWGCANVPGVRRETVDKVTPLLLLEYKKMLISTHALNKLVDQITKYPAKCGWTEKFATPDNKPATVPPSVPGWNAEWLEKRRKLQLSDFRLQEFWRQDKKWKWSTDLRGPLRVPRQDDLATGFRLMNFAKLKTSEHAARFELQELYTDVEDIEP